MSKISGFVDRASGTGRPTKKSAEVLKTLPNLNLWMILILTLILTMKINEKDFSG